MPRHVRELYASFEKRNGVNSSPYHLAQLKTWIKRSADTFAKGSSSEKADCLLNLVDEFCRPLEHHEYSGSLYQRNVNLTAEAGLYSGQKAVLKIISRQIKHLDPDDQHYVLKHLIEYGLEHMGHSVYAAHDPQRKAIRMLTELLPALRMSPDYRANLTTLLLHKLTEGNIGMDSGVGGLFNRKVKQTSDVAAQLVGRELRLFSRSKRVLQPQNMAALQHEYDWALSTYHENKGNGEPTRLHTKIWKGIFEDTSLDPSNPSPRQPNKLVKKSRRVTIPSLDDYAQRIHEDHMRRSLEEVVLPSTAASFTNSEAAEIASVLLEPSFSGSQLSMRSSEGPPYTGSIEQDHFSPSSNQSETTIYSLPPSASSGGSERSSYRQRFIYTDIDSDSDNDGQSTRSPGGSTGSSSAREY